MVIYKCPNCGHKLEEGYDLNSEFNFKSCCCCGFFDVDYGEECDT